jgi:hypothetical protein
MSRHTYHRSDLNQSIIITTLRQCGCNVQSLSSVGGGCPDLLVQFRGVLYLMEVKNPEQKKSDRQLRKTQTDFHSIWSGVLTVTNKDEALRAIGAI